jgi:hypothetical protein
MHSDRLLNSNEAEAMTNQVERAGLFVFRDLAAGLRVLTGVALKNCAQPGLNCARFWIMQAVTRSTSGMAALQRRKASPVQSCC